MVTQVMTFKWEFSKIRNTFLYELYIKLDSIGINMVNIFFFSSARFRCFVRISSCLFAFSRQGQSIIRSLFYICEVHQLGKTLYHPHYTQQS